MKFSGAPLHAVLGWALVLSASPGDATHSHNKMHELFAKRRHHTHSHLQVRHAPLARHSPEEAAELEKRGTCSFPADADPNLVAVTPDEKNGGWAMSPDQPCTKDSYCPYACKPGMVMAQWEEGSSFTYPSSMNGGLYCNKNGEIEKPFPSKPYCKKGTGTVKAVNKCGKQMSFCQTVLPGNEAMLIPTLVEDAITIAVPDPSYWEETAAHYYINPPGTGEEGCIWGDSSKEIGNWSPFVVGANTDSSGRTFVKLGHNPIFEESSLSIKNIDFGVKIECPDGDCDGIPCAIDPSKGAGIVDTLLGGTGAGGSDFCVVTVPSGSSANIVTYSLDGSGGESDDDSDSDSDDSLDLDLDLEIQAEPSTSEEPEEPSTTEEPPTTTQEPTTSQEPTSSAEPTTTSEPEPTTSTTSSTSTSTSTTSSKSRPVIKPGVFHEQKNETTTFEPTQSETSSSGDTTTTSSEEPAETTDEDDNGVADRRPNGPAAVGLFIAFAAAAYFF